jgi:hypothetical protein
MITDLVTREIRINRGNHQESNKNILYGRNITVYSILIYKVYTVYNKCHYLSYRESGSRNPRGQEDQEDFY